MGITVQTSSVSMTMPLQLLACTSTSFSCSCICSSCLGTAVDSSDCVFQYKEAKFNHYSRIHSICQAKACWQMLLFALEDLFYSRAEGICRDKCKITTSRLRCCMCVQACCFCSSLVVQ